MYFLKNLSSFFYSASRQPLSSFKLIKKNMDKNAITSTVIGVLGGILGVFVGQIMGASVESDKFLREKIQESYYRVLSLPQLAQNFHSSALNKMDAQNFEFYSASYNDAHEKYTKEIKYIVSISDLYERSLSVQTSNIAECSKKFTNSVSIHMLLEAQAGGKTLAGQLRSYKNPNEPLSWDESVKTMASLRLECDVGLDKLKIEIANAMQKHL